MERLEATKESDGYDTAINVIGGLRDCSVILRAIEAHFSQSDSIERAYRTTQ